METSPVEWCGACGAGILVMNGNQIQRCDDCKLFAEDIDAAAAVDELLALLGRVHREGGRTVADALELITEATEARLK